MDRLSFHQIIIFPEISDNPTSNYSAANSSQLSLISDKELSCVITTASQDETSSQESDDDEGNNSREEDRPMRLNNKLVISSKKTRWDSSSPLSGHEKQSNYPTWRCKSLGKLELEEVKGFMDLGFIFKKENLSRQLIKLIPGLHRIDKQTESWDNEEEAGIMRPYLSEAWIVKRSDINPPLLNSFEVCSGGVDMKEHLKFWARSVASAIHQGS